MIEIFKFYNCNLTFTFHFPGLCLKIISLNIQRKYFNV